MCPAATVQRWAVDASQSHRTPGCDHLRTGAYHRRLGSRGARGTVLPGTLRRFGGYQIVARSVVRGGERPLPCPRNRITHGAAGADRLAGQMSRDTLRLPHEMAREYASTGSAAPWCGIRRS